MGKNAPDPTLLWRDRKRILGLPITFTVYTVKNSRLYVRKGFFNTDENEMLLYRILDFKLKVTLWNKLFGVGTLTLFTADATDNQLELQNIKHPEKVRDLISNEVEKEREKIKIRGREIYGVSDADGLDGADNIYDGDADGSDN